MKKFYMLLGAGLATSVAMAGPTQLSKVVESAEMMQITASSCKESVNADLSAPVQSKKFTTRADATVGDATVSESFQNFYIGLNQAGSYYAQSWCLAPCWGTLLFKGAATGATDFAWNWNNGYNETSQDYKEFEKSGADLTVDLQPGEMVSDLILTAKNGDAQEQTPTRSSLYMMGASPAYYLGSTVDMGVGLYPCMEYKEDGRYMGTSVGYMSIDKTDPTNYNSTSGAATGWYDLFAEQLSVKAEDISNFNIESFSYVIPAMSSPYMFTQFWGWINAKFTAATTLKGTVYALDDKGNRLAAPVAKFSSNVDSNTGSNIVFDVVPVDEDGDEVDGNVIIDNQTIELVIEGLGSNPAVQKFTPVYGNGTIYPKGSQSPWYVNSFIQLTFETNGKKYTYDAGSPYNYYADDARTLLFKPANYHFYLDVKYPYVFNSATGERDFNVVIDAAGGESVVNAEAYYYNLKALLSVGNMEMTAEDWLTVTVGDADSKTGVTAITVKAAALPAGVTGRTGAVKFTGFAQDFTINVTQGDGGAGVGEIAVDNNAATVYFDLQGRQMNAAPEKGIYLVKEGNKVTKVIR